MSTLSASEIWPAKPRYRGIPHSLGALLAIPATILVALEASSGVGTTGALIYGLSLVFLLSTSALYHTPTWPPRVRMWFRRVDHLAIFVLIAGSYTPMCLLALPPAEGTSLLITVWSFAAVGALLSLFWPLSPRWLNVGLTVTMGWLILPHSLIIAEALGPLSISLMVVGGVLYSLGGLAYARRAPNPIPEVFGHHEVFHCLVLAAAACHYAAIWRLVV
jgi:hemolysin III